MKAYYAAISPTGELIGLEESPESAVRVVERQVGGPISVQYLEGGDLNANPAGRQPTAEEMPELAEEMGQIPRISRDAVMAMPAKEAQERLKPFFDGLELRGAEVKKYTTVSGMAEAWIGQNYKTEKPSQDPDRPVEVMGLTLVPANHARLASIGRGPYERLFELGPKTSKQTQAQWEAAKAALAQTKLDMLARWKMPGIGLPPRITSSFTLCQGSSKECRDSCLIFAGQNASERYNTYRKVAQAYALLNQPVAFMRMLLESIDKWLLDCAFYRRPNVKMEITPMLRLNVLSDIMWERIAPWFFDYYRGKGGENQRWMRIYDYTKVPGRRAGHRDGGRFIPFPRNYDLTFSLSGTDINAEYAVEEIDKYESRIAAVLLAYKREDGRWQTFTPQAKKSKGETIQQLIPLPKRFRFGPADDPNKFDLAIRDGDLSDARPWDGGKTCVALRWKVPSGKRSGAPELKYEDVEIGGETVSRAKLSFVTPIYVKGTKASRYEPNPDDDGAVLIAALTPRHQSIIQHLSQAG